MLSNLIDQLSLALDVYVGGDVEESVRLSEGSGSQYVRYDDETGGAVNIRDRERNAGEEEDKAPARRTSSYSKPAAKSHKISINGKIWAKDGKPVSFTSDRMAAQVRDKIAAKDPKNVVKVISEEFNDSDTDKIISAWKAAKSEADEKSVIKKYNLTTVISAVRPGEVKLGLKNQLNGKKTFAGLDAEGFLVLVTGTPSAPKINRAK